MSNQEPAQQFIESVLHLNLRKAAFDCDGTLWSGDAGADFFYWELDRGLLPPEVSSWARRRYSTYEEGKVDETVMCGEMVTLHKGLEDRVVAQAAEEFVAEIVEPRIFPEMRRLVAGLSDAGCEVWAVSSTAEWVVRAGVCRLGIAHVLAASAALENGRITGRLIRVPTDDGKARACATRASPSSMPPSATRCTTSRCWRWRATRSPSTRDRRWRSWHGNAAGPCSGLTDPAC